MDVPNNITELVLGFLATVTGGAAWVGKIQTRVGKSETEIDKIGKALTDHFATDLKLHEGLARIDERTKNTATNVERLLSKR